MIMLACLTCGKVLPCWQHVSVLWDAAAPNSSSGVRLRGSYWINPRRRLTAELWFHLIWFGICKYNETLHLSVFRSYPRWWQHFIRNSIHSFKPNVKWGWHRAVRTAILWPCHSLRKDKKKEKKSKRVKAICGCGFVLWTRGFWEIFWLSRAV